MNPALGDVTAELGPTERLALENVVNTVLGDVNSDGIVDFYDLNALARSFGGSSFNDRADINGDGTVDRADIDLLKGAYTFSDPSETPPGDGTEAEPSLEGENPPLTPDDLNDEPSEDEPGTDPNAPEGETGADSAEPNDPETPEAPAEGEPEAPSEDEGGEQDAPTDPETEPAPEPTEESAPADDSAPEPTDEAPAPEAPAPEAPEPEAPDREG